MLEKRFGLQAARSVHEAMHEAVDEVGRVIATEGIDAQYLKGGKLLLARGIHQLPAVRSYYTTLQRQGVADQYQWLDGPQVAERIRVAGAVAGVYDTQCAVIHPGKLVRGLAHAVERLGGQLFEHTTVTDVVPGGAPRLKTSSGEVRANTLVLAGEAYLAQLPIVRRRLIPIYSLIVLTEPLSAAQWEEIGWQGHECVSSSRYTVDYLSRTADGRILFGGRGAPYHMGSRIADTYDRHAPTHAMLRQMLAQWFPRLQGIGFSHAWGGPLGMPRDWMPTMSYDRATGIATARGYTGQGVSTTNLSGRVLTDLILDVDSPLTTLPMVNHQQRSWEPEPLRWLGVRYVQRGMMAVDDKAERTGRPPTGRTLPELLGRH